MKIAIHNQPGSFSERWIQYCIENEVSYKIVNCYDSDIIDQLKNCDGLMWHWDLNDYKSKLFARQLTLSLEKLGKKVFPNVNTSWHYDDKLGQKYILEAIEAPVVPSYIFFSKADALKWIQETRFPKVFKLRGGAGSVNVRLVKNKAMAKKLAKRAFGKGFSPINRIYRLKDRVWIFRRDKTVSSFIKVIKGIGRIFIPTLNEKYSPKEIGYIYFQDFIPNNEYDSRIIIIGNKCFAIRRFCRKNDFRASGSGLVEYNPEYFSPDTISLAFAIADKLDMQSVAFDIIYENQCPRIVEISYCFVMGAAYDNCPGYWDRNLNWHETKINPQYFMIEDFIKELKNK